jgi:hypothetical protein
MKGDGIAVQNARLTATAEAGAAMTETAQARGELAALTATAEAESAAETASAGRRRDNLTATAEARSARLTATAEAGSARQTATAEARATRDAAEAMTATAAAQPSPTIVPSPTATPEAVGMSGKIDDVTATQLSLLQRGHDSATLLTVDADATITRDGQPATMNDLQKGDDANVTVDGVSGNVRILAASTPPVSIISRITGLWWLIPIGVMIPLVLRVKNRTIVEPFVVKRVAAG